MEYPTSNTGYSKLSIISHWLAAIAVLVLFVTHEGERGDIAYVIHVSGGAIAGLFLLWRVWHRVRNGMTDAPDQAMIFNLLSKIVVWGFLVAVLVATVTGYLLPWSRGAALDIFGIVSIPSPMAGSRGFHEFIEETHELAGHAIPVLLILHVLGAAKHLIINRDGIVARMFKPAPGGR